MQHHELNTKIVEKDAAGYLVQVLEGNEQINEAGAHLAKKTLRLKPAQFHNKHYRSPFREVFLNKLFVAYGTGNEHDEDEYDVLEELVTYLRYHHPDLTVDAEGCIHIGHGKELIKLFLSWKKTCDDAEGDPAPHGHQPREVRPDGHDQAGDNC